MTLLWAQAVIELVGGLLLAVGLFTRPVAFVLCGDMAVAYFMAHAPKNFFPLLNGGDAAILYCFLFLLLFVADQAAGLSTAVSAKINGRIGMLAL